eukprot:4198047-Amphidinium_carterae.1
MCAPDSGVVFVYGPEAAEDSEQTLSCVSDSLASSKTKEIVPYACLKADTKRAVPVPPEEAHKDFQNRAQQNSPKTWGKAY